MLLDQPLGVVASLEGVQRLQQLGHGAEAVQPKQLLLEGADEALGDTVACGLSGQSEATPCKPARVKGVRLSSLGPRFALQAADRLLVASHSCRDCCEGA